MQPELQPQEFNKDTIAIEKSIEVIPPQTEQVLKFLDAQKEVVEAERQQKIAETKKRIQALIQKSREMQIESNKYITANPEELPLSKASYMGKLIDDSEQALKKRTEIVEERNKKSQEIQNAKDLAEEQKSWNQMP